MSFSKSDMQSCDGLVGEEAALVLGDAEVRVVFGTNSCFPAEMEKAFAAAMDETINTAKVENFMVC